MSAKGKSHANLNFRCLILTLTANKLSQQGLKIKILIA